MTQHFILLRSVLILGIGWRLCVYKINDSFIDNYDVTWIITSTPPVERITVSDI